MAVLLEGLRHVRRDAKFYFAGSSRVKWGLNPRPVDLHFWFIITYFITKFLLKFFKIS